MNHVFRHPPAKGKAPCGYRPLTGLPRDAEGRLILEYIYPIEGAKPDDEAIRAGRFPGI